MAVFPDTYSETTPQGSDLANTLDTVIQTDKRAIDQRIELEHYSLVDGNNDAASLLAQGRHVPGKVQAVFIGTTAEINALTGMTKGSLAYDTDLGLLKIFNGSDWDTIGVGGVGTAAQRLAFAGYLGSNQNIPSNTETVVEVDTETFDSGSVFNTGTYKYTPNKAGMYLVTAGVYVTAFDGGERMSCRLLKNGTSFANGSLSKQDGAGSTEGQLSVATGLVSMNGSTDYIQLGAAHNGSVTRVIVAGVANTYLHALQVTEA